MCNHDNHQNDNGKGRHGSALDHGQAHEQDHRAWSRRMFLRNLGIAGGTALMLGKTPITALASSPLAWGLTNSAGDRILVLIRFKGGNDGLNTVVPLFDYGTYQAARPNLRIPQSEAINLNPDFGLHPQLNPLMPLWQNGRMKIINSVGYPGQNLSHFRSTDIWASASDAEVVDNSGWLGRMLEGQYPDFITNPPDIPPAIQIGGSGTVVFDNTEGENMSVQVEDPDTLLQIAQDGQLYNTDVLPDCHYGDQVGFLRTVANNTVRYAQVISQAYNSAANTVDYQGRLGQQFALLARLIKGGLGTKLYMVTLDGFDTHAAQANAHANLLNQLSVNTKAFYEDLAAGNKDEDVLCMSFSEFGRRIEQNASNGTDHGAASCLLLFGAGLNGNGVLGDNPDMNDVDNAGNLKYGTDFRQVYASILENWLCVDSGIVDQVMGQYFERLPGLGISCAPTPVFEAPVAQLKHWALYEGQNQVGIHYVLPRGANVAVHIFNMLGQPVRTLHRGYLPAGEHRHVFHGSDHRVTAGYYVYSIEVQGKAYSRKIVVAK